jgi:hypothetical protein
MISKRARIGILAKSFTLLTLAPLSSFGADLPPSISSPTAKKQDANAPKDNQVMSALLESLINTVQRMQPEFEFQGSIDSTTQKMKFDLLNLGAIFSLKENISQNLQSSESAAGQDPKLSGLIPVLQLGTKGLFVESRYNEVNGIGTFFLKFYSGFDSVKNEWQPTYLTARLTNKLNKNLLTVRLLQVDFTKKPTTGDQANIDGICISDKQTENIITGKPETKVVNCSFNATIDADNNFKMKKMTYVNKK